MIEQRVTLRYDAQQIPAIVQAVQGDTGRDVIFELADYEIPAGATANYYIDKPDGNAVYNSAEVISSTEIRAHLTEQALAVPGRNNGQVRILADDEVITSFDFVLEVDAFRGILHLQSETEINIFDAAIQAAVDDAIEEIQAQTPVVTGMQNSIAPTYSSSGTYAVGDYVMYNAQLYRCITAITTAEAWTAAHWTQVPLANDVDDLKSAIDAATKQYEITGSLLKDNCLIISDGTEVASSLWCASDFIDIYGSGGCVAVLTCTIYGTASVVWYDKDRVKMGYVSSDNCQSYGITAKQEMQTVKIIMPSNVAYIRICAWKTYMIGNMEVCVGAYNDANVVKTLANRTDQNTNQIQTVNNFIGKIKWKNKVNPAEITESAYIRATDGKLIGNNQYNNATGFIYLEPNTLYYFGGIASDNFYAFYSSNSENDFVSSPDVTIVDIPSGTVHAKGTIITHDTGYYFRGTIGKDWTTSPYVSDYADMYMPYGQMTLDDMIDIQSYSGKKVLIFGDSISTDAYGNYKKWVTNLIEDGKLPADTVNSSQHATGFVATSGGSYPSFITRLEAIQNKESFDLVVIFGGINDYIQNIPLGESGQDRTTYFKPAVDYFFQYLLNNFTQARICVLLPLRTYNIYPNTAGNKQEVYSEYINEVAKYYCLPVLNLTEESGFCPFIDSFKIKWTLVPSGYTEPDGVHPNADYEKEYLAPMIWKFISGLII